MKPRGLILIFVLIFYSISFFHAGPAHSNLNQFVRWVDDGDTIVMVDGRRVRYIGVNSPETGFGTKQAEPFAQQAKNFNKKLVYKRRIRLELDREKHDHYGRLLAYIFLPTGTFVNKEMLSEGYAYYLYRYPNVNYHDALIKAQQRAMELKIGIWKNWNEKKILYLGNKRSRRFHLQTCPLALKMSARNKVFFTSKWEAFWTGYAPAKKCFAFNQ